MSEAYLNEFEESVDTLEIQCPVQTRTRVAWCCLEHKLSLSFNLRFSCALVSFWALKEIEAACVFTRTRVQECKLLLQFDRQPNAVSLTVITLSKG